MQSSHAALQRQVVDLSTARESGGVENADALDNVGLQGRRSAGVRRPRQQTSTVGASEQQRGTVNIDAEYDEERGSDPASESFDVDPASGHVPGITNFRAKVPRFSGKKVDNNRYRHEFINFARGEGLDHVFTAATDSANDIDVGNPELSMPWLERTYGKARVAAHVRARRLLVASLEGKKEQEMLVRYLSLIHI